MSAPGRLRIASVSTLLPTARRPHDGVFVARRLDALARYANVERFQPVPWFPFFRPRPPVSPSRTAASLTPMFYLPGVLRSLHGHWLARAILPQVRRLQRESGLDLIDAHFGHPTGTGCTSVGDRLGLPTFITLRGYELKWRDDPVMRRVLGRALRRAAGVIAVSRPLAGLAEELGVSAERLRVIPNGVDPELFHPGDSIAARSRLGIAPGTRLVVSIGYRSRSKRLVDILRALARLTRSVPDARLAVLGGWSRVQPYRRGELERLASSLGVTDRVLWVGPVAPDAVPEWLRAADVCCLAEAVNGCSNVLLEALACGTRVAATNSGENPRFVQTPAQGELFELGNVQALTSALARILRTSGDPEATSASVSSRTWDRVAGEVLDFFQGRLAAVDPGRCTP